MLDHRQRGGVGGQDGPLGAHAVELLEQLELHGQVLDHRLDDQVDGRRGPSVRWSPRSRPRISSRSASVRLPLSDLAVQRLRTPASDRVGGLLVAAPDHHGVPAGRRDLGDPGAHDPGPDDAHALIGIRRIVPAGNQPPPRRIGRRRAAWQSEEMAGSTGTLALVGGAEWSEGCTFDEELLAASGGTAVLVLPTAAAYEKPERLVVERPEWFAASGRRGRGADGALPGRRRGPAGREVVRRARFLYLSGGSSLHLRSVLKGSVVFGALREAWADGAVVAGAGAGAMALTDPMVDPRGGALTVGLGLIEGMAVFTHYGDVEEDAHGEKLHRSVTLAPEGLPVVGLPERTALVRDPGGSWRSVGCRPPLGVRRTAARPSDGVAPPSDAPGRARGSVGLFDGDGLDDDPLLGRARGAPVGVDGLPRRRRPRPPRRTASNWGAGRRRRAR